MALRKMNIQLMQSQDDRLKTPSFFNTPHKVDFLGLTYGGVHFLMLEVFIRLLSISKSLNIC